MNHEKYHVLRLNDLREFHPGRFNIEPENDGLEDDVPFQTGDFQVPC